MNIFNRIYRSTLGRIIAGLASVFSAPRSPGKDDLPEWAGMSLILGGRLFKLRRKQMAEAPALMIGDKKIARVQFTAADGGPANVDGAPVWSTSDSAVLGLTPASDGMSCVIEAKARGVAELGISADADLGQGIESLTGSVEVAVLGGKATGMVFSFEDVPAEEGAGGTDGAPSA